MSSHMSFKERGRQSLDTEERRPWRLEERFEDATLRALVIKEGA